MATPPPFAKRMAEMRTQITVLLRSLLVASNRQREETFACTESVEIGRWK